MDGGRTPRDSGSMDTANPFCAECGSVGVMLSGMHPAADGVVHWAIFRCGHTSSVIVFDEEPAGDEPDLLAVVPASV